MTETIPSRRRKPQARALATRMALLEAALAEFGERGYDSASTRGICERAGVASTLITHHFGHKEALWQAAARHVFQLYEERLDRRLQGLQGVDLATRLRLILKEYVYFCAERPEFHQFMLEASRAGGERMAWLANEFLNRDNIGQAQQIGEAQAAGCFIDGDPLHLRYLLIGAVNSIFAFAGDFQRVTGQDPFAPATVERHAELVVRLFVPDE